MAIRLETRLTISYVASIAVILVGFSVALYAMASKHLYRRADERLEWALNTLSALVEFGPGGVEWEPEQRNLTFGRRTLEVLFSWRVADDAGRRLDGSATGEIDRSVAQLGAGAGPVRRYSTFNDEMGVTWRAMTCRLDRPLSGRSDLAPGRHEALVLGVVASLGGVEADLRNLTLTLGGLSLAVWTLALGAGRRVCRIVLRPLTEMADAAHAIGGDEPGRRLPSPMTDDELGELGRSFNALLDRLGESLERQQRFTGDASHQLRTPLTSLQGHVDLALRQARTAEEYHRTLSLVQSKARHLRQIVEGLMFLSRADAEARRPALEAISLDSWLREHLGAWPEPRRPDLVYQADARGPCRVLVHPPLLGELLDNLLDNAAKYSPTGTPIRVRLSRGGGEARFSVSDDGPGIDRADLPRVFDPFFRSEAARLRGSQGLGLGLSVAARIAAAFGGRIRVDSTPARGATFSVDLPEVEGPQIERSLTDFDTLSACEGGGSINPTSPRSP